MPSGGAIANFSIAVGESWKNKQSGSKEEHTEWVNVTVFGKLAEICGEYLKKGSQVYISGKMRTEKWQDNNGNDRYTTKIIANNMQILGARGGSGGASSGQHSSASSASPPPAAGADDFDDDIPF